MKMNFLLPLMLILGSQFLHAMNNDAEKGFTLKTYNRRSDFDDAAIKFNLKNILNEEVTDIDKKLLTYGIDDFEIIVWSEEYVSLKFNNYQHSDYFAQHLQLTFENNSTTYKLIRMAKTGKSSDEIPIQRDEAVSLIISFLSKNNKISKS